LRLILLPICALAIVGTTPEQAAGSHDRMMPGYGMPAEKWSSVEEALSDSQCADRIEQVRDLAGQPKLDREPANPEAPLLIAAVDKRIDGCPVLQMKNNVNDLRPVPSAADGPVHLMPAR
jgi:hypothetical protein